jgi:hypothetical protein
MTITTDPGSRLADAVRDAQAWRIAVVIPCYRVRNHILQVLAAIGDE